MAKLCTAKKVNAQLRISVNRKQQLYWSERILEISINKKKLKKPEVQSFKLEQFKNETPANNSFDRLYSGTSRPNYFMDPATN